MKVTMTQVRETKNKVVYEEAGETPKIGKLYIPHAEAKKLGKEITITVEKAS